MAKKRRIADPDVNEVRADVTWRYAALLSAFAILCLASIFTVMIPELTDDGAEDEADAAGATTEMPPITDALAPAPSTAP